METLLVFLAIAAIQMAAAYAKQKKEAAKKAQEYHLPPKAPEPSPIPEPFFESEPSLEWELESDLKPVHTPEVVHHHVSHAPTPAPAPTHTPAPIPPNCQLSTINYQLNLKDPAQGILWTAILHEPRYKVKWKQR